MKKILLLAMVMCIAIPALAVTIGLTDNEDGTGTIYYTAAAGEVVRGISLKVTLSDGDLVATNPTLINSEFNVFMDSAWFMEDDDPGSYNIGNGTPLAKHDMAGPLDPILDATDFSICMGVVDESGNQLGASVGTYDLLTIEVDAETVVTIIADPLRGGIVGDNLASDSITGGPITMAVAAVYDFGDAPDPLDATAGEYPTLLSDGARHIILESGNPFLGPEGDEPDAETDGQPNGTATGDDGDGNDDENGVTIGALSAGDAIATVTFEVNGAPTTAVYVDGWVDFNANGVFEGGEKIVSATYTDGTYSPTFAVPGGATIGLTYVRFRINTVEALDPDGDADDGEVEDHTVLIVPCWGDITTSDSLGDPDGRVNMGDLNLIIALMMLSPQTGFSISPYPVGYENADVSTPDSLGPPLDGIIDMGDLNLIIAHLMVYAPQGFDGPCMIRP